MDFPQYRKLPGFNRFYRIENERNFFESYTLNGKEIVNHVVANQFPEMLRIKDMLEFNLGYIEMTPKEISAHFPN